MTHRRLSAFHQSPVPTLLVHMYIWNIRRYMRYMRATELCLHIAARPSFINNPFLHCWYTGISRMPLDTRDLRERQIGVNISPPVRPSSTARSYTAGTRGYLQCHEIHETTESGRTVFTYGRPSVLHPSPVPTLLVHMDICNVMRYMRRLRAAELCLHMAARPSFIRRPFLHCWYTGISKMTRDTRDIWERQKQTLR